MNPKNILRVARYIEAFPTHFDLGQWVNNPNTSYSEDTVVADLTDGCGTTACIAGWASAVDAVEDGRSNIGHPTESFIQVAARYLGLSERQAFELCVPSSHSHNIWVRYFPDLYPYDATAAHAAQLLRAIANGEVLFHAS